MPQMHEELAAIAMPAVRVDALRHVFDNGVVALDGVNLQVQTAEFLAILGPSGCGKSTLLRLVAGLERATDGSAEVARPAGHTLHGAGIAYVFQDAHLLPWRTALQNVALPLELLRVPKAQRTAAAKAALEQVGLGDAMGRYPAQLSGGMRMRVSLARAMATEPKLLLLDEPFAALDEITRQRLDEQLRELWLRRKFTVLFVTHSTTEAVFLADRAVVFSARPGHVIFDKPIELPAERAGAIRATSDFARQTRGIYEALERAGG